MNHVKSINAFEEACKVLVGGVDSPVRSFQSVNTTPIFVDYAQGSHVVDLDGNTYIDYIGSWGPMILGHAHPDLLEGVQAQMQKGLSFGLPCEKESELAKLIIEAYPGLERLRFVTSGTEATMSAIRVARGYTKRDKLIKFPGCYHGHSDGLLVKSGSGALTNACPDSQGVPDSIVQDTLLCTYNDIHSVKAMIRQYPNEIACIILEPIAGNMGVVPADKTFLQELRNLCDEAGIVLIFDEVITGFRVAYGGAAQLYGVTPDLACFGKIIGAGMSVGAYGGRKDIMEHVSPLGGVYQAGTLAGNPVAMHMGIAQLTYLKQHPSVYEHLEALGKQLQEGIEDIIKKHNLKYQVKRVGSLLTIFFTNHPIDSYNDVSHCDEKAFQRYYQILLEEGVLCAPSQYEAIFLSAAHSVEEIIITLKAMEKALVGSTL